MEKIEYRAYIKIRTLLGIKATVIHEELSLVKGDNAPSLRTVQDLAKQFRSGRENIEDEPRPGRPRATFNKANVELVRQIIIEDPHVTYDELEALTSINRFTIYEIIHDGLRLRKLASRYIPHHLSDENRQQRVQSCKENLAYYRDGPGRLSNILTEDEVYIYFRQIGRKSSNACWIGKGEKPKTVVRRGNFDSKRMFSIFFRSTGIVLVHMLERAKTMNNIYYIDHCLVPALKAIKDERPSTGADRIRLLHDNARPHIHNNVHKFLETEGVKLISHPPYSPDLAPCDFWLFDYIKRNLDDYDNEISLFQAVQKIVQDIPVREYKKTFEKWIQRMELCIENDGNYFEHIMK
jgi:histone-lysine N-methyltransferase SETMAR